MNGKSYDEIKMENKPSKPKDHLFNVGDQLIVTIGAVSRPEEDSESEVNYLIVGGKSDEWVGEDTLSKSAIPLEADTANFVSGYKSGWKEGYEAAQKKDQEYIIQFMSHFFGEKEDNGEETPGDGDKLGWIDVNKKLPEKDQETWVCAVNHKLGMMEVDEDYYMGNRGEIVKYTGPDGEGEEPTSGWYTYSGWDVLYWMPLTKPEPPEGANA